MEKDQDLQRHAELNLKRMLGNPDADKSKDMLTGMAKSKGYDAAWIFVYNRPHTALRPV
jgi:hypothetical protein